MKRSPSFEELQRPLPLFSPRRALYGVMKLFLRTVGNLSDGIRIGNTYGYDSGVMLDYVYKHRAGGRLGIGRLIELRSRAAWRARWGRSTTTFPIGSRTLSSWWVPAWPSVRCAGG